MRRHVIWEFRNLVNTSDLLLTTDAWRYSGHKFYVLGSRYFKLHLEIGYSRPKIMNV